MCSILVVNAWEIILKAFIVVNLPEIKILDKDGLSKPLDDCMDTVFSKLGTEFRTSYENLKLIYEYRCRIIHFYEDRIDVLLFSLLSKNVVLYYEFLLKHFAQDISNETNLHLMPIGFKRPISPIDFLSDSSEIAACPQEVKEFVKSLTDRAHAMAKDGVEDSVLMVYKMAVLNENRVKNADIIAAISKDKQMSSVVVENVLGKVEFTDDESAKKVKVEEESLYDNIYTETHQDVVNNSRRMFSGFSTNRKFNSLMKDLRGNPNFHKTRFLDIKNQAGGAKNYYTKHIYEELGKHYTPKT